MTAHSVFGTVYADQYDLLYQDKDYDTECDLIEDVFGRYGQGKIETILDLGCGTGNHAIPLARRGYRVTGVDRSAEMLVNAEQKTHADLSAVNYHHPTFLQGDVRTFNLEQQFDAVLMMFAVLGYQLTNDDVLAALHSVRRHLKPGGLFICDMWYGAAVLAIRPSDRVKVIPIANGQLIRAVSSRLDVYQHLCEVRYHLWRLCDRKVAEETEEAHQMRFFFPQELGLFFSQTGLELINMSAFDDPERLPDETTWNVLAVSMAV